MVGFGCSVRKSLCTLNLYSGLIQHTKFGKYTTEAFYDTKVPSLAVQIITDVVSFILFGGYIVNKAVNSPGLKMIRMFLFSVFPN